MAPVKRLVASLSGHIWMRSGSLRQRLREVPVAGRVLGSLAKRLLPQDATAWMRVRSGLAKGLWLQLRPRFDRTYWTGEYEAEVQRALSERLRPGMVFCDVGAHIGFFSLIGARLVGPSGLVVAIEADAGNAARILAHAERNGMRRLEVVAAAAWSHGDGIRFRPDGAASGRNTGRAAETRAQAGDAVAVPSVTLDALFGGRRPPDVVKIDVEGGEIDVLAGAVSLLERYRPVLILEVHDDVPDSLVIGRLGARYALRRLAADTAGFPARLLAAAPDGRQAPWAGGRT